MTLYNTREEAVSKVPDDIEPKECFVWQVGNKWQVIPGTGCAHWVSHEKGYRGKPLDDGCFSGYNIRVNGVLGQLHRRDSINDAQVGDVWKQINASHIGIVTDIERKEGKVVRLTIRQDSSNQSHPGVGEITVTTGEFYYG